MNKPDPQSIVGMPVNHYQWGARQTAVFPKKNALAYLSLGLANEAGEAAGKVKKYFRGDFDKEHLKSEMVFELGDVLWYLAVLADELGIDMDTIMAANLNKLRQRQAAGTLKGDGDHR